MPGPTPATQLGWLATRAYVTADVTVCDSRSWLLGKAVAVTSACSEWPWLNRYRCTWQLLQKTITAWLNGAQCSHTAAPTAVQLMHHPPSPSATLQPRCPVATCQCSSIAAAAPTACTWLLLPGILLLCLLLLVPWLLLLPLLLLLFAPLLLVPQPLLQTQ
jgi:hypothetical protein